MLHESIGNLHMQRIMLSRQKHMSNKLKELLKQHIPRFWVMTAALSALASFKTPYACFLSLILKEAFHL